MVGNRVSKSAFIELRCAPLFVCCNPMFLQQIFFTSHHHHHLIQLSVFRLEQNKKNV